MKKLLLIIIGIILVFCIGLTACNSNVEQDNNKKVLKETEETNVKTKDLNQLTEVTIPAILYNGTEGDPFKIKEQYGVDEIIINDDGSRTYKMTLASYNKWVNAEKEKTTKFLDGVTKDCTTVKKITYEKDFSEVTLEVNRDEFDKGPDGLIRWGIGMSLGLTRAINKKADFGVKVKVKDITTSIVYDEYNYPEDAQADED